MVFENMNNITRRENTKRVICGGTLIGGGAPITIQSMTNTKTEDETATAAQIIALADAGADIVRVSVPTEKAALSLTGIKTRVRDAGFAVPVVADIHFDYRLAVSATLAGADKIRINPGNIGGAERLKAVVDAAGSAGIPMRIGINGGSLEEDLKQLYTTRPAEALAESAVRNIGRICGMGFEDIVVSVKDSDVLINAEAHRLLAAATDLPLHIGITEAGVGASGAIKSAVGIGALLAMGIGDTIRVSITGDPLAEIPPARDILRSVNQLPGQITLISCPTCGRCRVDLASLADELSAALAEAESARIKAARKSPGTQPASPLTVALMGCAVNGPGEASCADLGVACGADGGVYFEKGVKGNSIPYEEIVPTIISRLATL